MAKRTNQKIETPGASAPAESTAESPSPEATESESGGQSGQAAGVDAAPSAPAPAATPTVANSMTADAQKDAELNRRVEATKELVGSSAALDWSHLSSPARLMSVVGANAPDKDPNAHLPSPDAVDWSKTSDNRVLTKQGWLLRP